MGTTAYLPIPNGSSNKGSKELSLASRPSESFQFLEVLYYVKEGRYSNHRNNAALSVSSFRWLYLEKRKVK
jgi:hypothetical protein